MDPYVIQIHKTRSDYMATQITSNLDVVMTQPALMRVCVRYPQSLCLNLHAAFCL